MKLINHDHIFKRGKDEDGMAIWKCLLKHPCPTTKVSSSNHKDLLDAATLKEFQHNVKNFNSWLEDRRKDIIRDEASDKYDERIRHLLKSYLTATNADFIIDIKKERTDWMTGKNPSHAIARI